MIKKYSYINCIKMNTINCYYCKNLFYASERCHLDCIKQFVENGSDVNEKNITYKTECNFGVYTALHFASASQYQNNKECVEYLLKKGANINTTGHNGWTALHVASKRGNKEVITLLLKNGADQNIEDQDGMTAYDLAGSNEIEKLFFSIV